MLDVGCGKAFLLYEIKKILPDLKIAGFDISQHGLADARDTIKPYLFRYRAQDRYPYGDKAFDLVISLGTLHNLRLFELETAVSGNRAGRQEQIYHGRGLSERAASSSTSNAGRSPPKQFYIPSEWIWLYNHFGYTGDYEFIYFE